MAARYAPGTFRGMADAVAALEIARAKHPDLLVVFFGTTAAAPWVPRWIEYRRHPSQTELETSATVRFAPGNICWRLLRRIDFEGAFVWQPTRQGGLELETAHATYRSWRAAGRVLLRNPVTYFAFAVVAAQPRVTPRISASVVMLVLFAVAVDAVLEARQRRVATREPKRFPPRTRERLPSRGPRRKGSTRGLRCMGWAEGGVHPDHRSVSESCLNGGGLRGRADDQSGLAASNPHIPCTPPPAASTPNTSTRLGAVFGTAPAHVRSEQRLTQRGQTSVYVTTHAVGIVTLDLHRGPGGPCEHPVTKPRGETLDLRLDALGHVDRRPRGHMTVGPQRAASCRCARWVDNARLHHDAIGTLGVPPRSYLRLGAGYLLECAPQVDGSGFPAHGRFPRDRAIERPVDLAHARSVLKALKGSPVAFRQTVGCEIEQLAWCDIEHHQLGVGEAPRVRTHCPVSTCPPSDSSSLTSASVTRELPPCTTGHPDECAIIVNNRA